MILEENKLDSQDVREFEELLKEYVKINPSKIIEIGSMYGWSLQHFIHYGADESTVLAIDLPVRMFVGPTDWRVAIQEDNYKNVWPKWAKAKKSKLYLIPDASQKDSTVKQTKEIFNNEQIDFLFIDGDHRYEAIKQDFILYSPLVRKGGIVAFHDIGEREEGGGAKFWKEIKNNYTHKEILINEKKEKGIGVLYV